MCRPFLAILALAAGLLPAAAAAQVTALAGAAIDGPPPPVAPAVMARDEQGRVTVRAVRVHEPLHVDGVLDDPPYQSILPIGDFIQQEPDEGARATEATSVWVLFDDHHLYVAARCHDSQPHRIVANDMRRDGRGIGQNDNLSVVLDTFYDRRNGYEFLVNAINGMMDVQITDERDTNRDWNTVWMSRSRIDDHGWTVEIAIPFRSLRYRRSEGPQVWGLNIRRTVRWKNEFSYLSAVPRTQGVRGILKLSSAATLVDLQPPHASLNLEVKPYGLAAAKADRAVDPRFGTDLDGNGGFDVKYGVRRSLTADFTYRTDFAQVEDDDQQVNLTRFNLFVPEKREFFLEGQGIFGFGGIDVLRPGQTATAPTNTPILFFSRRIGLSEGRPVPIDVGGRLTGKAGAYSVGLLDVRTGQGGAEGPPATNFGVIRLKRDILRRSYIGVIGTHRSAAVADSADNLAVGVDANFSFFESLNMLGYYARTSTPGVVGSQSSHRVRFDYDADLFGLQVERLAVGQAFRPEVGFLRRSDFIEHLAEVRVSRRPRGRSIVRKASLEAGLDYITDGRRRLENREWEVGIDTEFANGDAWELEYERSFEFLPIAFDITPDIEIPSGTYRAHTVRTAYTLGTHRRASGEISLAHGGFYDGERTDVGYTGRVELSARLSVEPGASLNRVDLPEGRFTAKLFSARTTLTFSPTMWVGALVQYNSTARLFSTNVRFRWEYAPGSDLFVVYSEGRDPLQRAAPTLLNRSFAIKATRLFRL